MNFATYAQWSAILTAATLLLTVLAFAFGWGIRFRLVGITGFMAVLSTGLFALGLGLFARTEIPGAVRFTRVYDNGANRVVVAVPASISESQLEATLRQAASDLSSSGRLGIGGDNKLTIRARALLHPEPGISQPLYLGQVRRSLGVRKGDDLEIEIFRQNLAHLPPS